jgi:hypothetical protein
MVFQAPFVNIRNAMPPETFMDPQSVVWENDSGLSEAIERADNRNR